MTGRKITTNPHTGLPEAFSFGDFLTSLIPTGVGMLLGGPAGAAMGLEGSMATAAPIVGGMAAGAAVAGAKGEDPLMGGLMGGLGGFGGGNLAKSLGTLGASPAATPGVSGLTSGQIQNALQVPANEAANIAQYGPTTDAMKNTLSNIKEFGPLTGDVSSPMTYSEGLAQMGKGAQTALSDLSIEPKAAQNRDPTGGSTP